MDKKGTLIATGITVVLVLGWMWLQTYINQHWPAQPVTPPGQSAQNDAPASTQPSATQPSTDAAGGAPPLATQPTTGPAFVQAPSVAPAPAQPTGWRVVPPPPDAGGPTPAVLGSARLDDKAFPLQVEVSPLGAGIAEVTLNHFRNPADFDKPEKDRRPYKFQQPYAHYADTAPLATKSITVNGQTVPLHNVAWTRQTPAVASVASGDEKYDVGTSVNYTAALADGQGGTLRLTKTYTVHDVKHAGLGYEVTVAYEVKNESGAPVKVKSLINGPTLPPREAPRPPDRQVMAGFAGKDGMLVESHPVESFSGSKPLFDLTKNEDGHPGVWAGTASVYFNAFLLPDNGKRPEAQSIVKMTAEGLGGELENPHMPPEERAIVLGFETAERELKPGEAFSVPLDAYFGPRWRDVLSTAHYANAPRDYDASLVIKVGPCAFCTFDWLIDGLVWLLAGFHFLFRDWGLAIIALVAIVRLILHPVTKRSQVQMMKMGKLGPEVEKLKKKYGDDKDELNKQMMLLYKEQGFAPVLGCLPMFLQMPIWIALYSALQTTFELRQAPFLWGYTWIQDLAKPDYLIRFNQPIPLLFFGWTLDAINLLPIAMGVVFWLNQKYTPKPPATTPEQQQQQKMMQWMTLLFPVFLYNGPSGLNLYIFTSTLIGIIESKVIRDHIKQREEAEKAGVVIVDAGRPTRAARRGAGKDPEPEPPKKGGIMGWLQQLQEKAEQVRKEQDRRGGRKA